MRSFFLLAMLFSVVGKSQDLVSLPLTKAEVSQKIKAHYSYQSEDGHFALLDLWLMKNGTYEYKITSNTYNGFSEGTWKQSNRFLTLTSKIQKDNLPIKVSFRPKDSSDFDVKKIAFVKDLKGNVITNVFVYINNDSTSCLDGDLMCQGEYDLIKRIRVQYENFGITSQWININPFKGLLQIIIQTTKDLSRFIVFDEKKIPCLECQA
jgi:hypothetical protein